MIRHCVMFKWREDASAEGLAEFKAGLVEMLNTGPTVRGFAHGADIGAGQGNHDYCVTVDFDDEAGYAAYRDDAHHREFIVTTVRPILDNRAAVQFEY